MEDAALETTLPHIEDDADRVAHWLGYESAEAFRGAPHDARKEAAHEKWADGAIRYFAEGRAPSLTLARAFENFKRWLLEIYQALRNIGAPISDDIRRTFDHLLASDEEIRQAQALREGRSPDQVWHMLAKQPGEAEHSDVVASANAVAAMPEPASTEPRKSLAAAQQAAADADEYFRAMLPYMTPEERAPFENALAEIDREAAAYAHVIEASAECLARAAQ
jgi:hypothetical protein